jgi:hypothetical protein
MSYVETIVCFANSRKMAGRCIAGKEWRNGKPGEWVRPVSSRPTHEISEEERRYENGRDPQILDIIRVPCDSHQPLPHQRENHVIDPEYYWVKDGHLPWSNIHGWLDNPENLWGLGQASYAGLNNRVVAGHENGTSLYLVSAERLCLLVGRKAPKYPDSKRTVRGEFVYRGETYRMDVTDPVVERNFLARDDGQYDISSPMLCISLGDFYQGYYYKLIAAALFSERFT